MYHELRNHARKKVPGELHSEAETVIIMAKLQKLKGVALKLRVTIKVHIPESLPGNFIGFVVLELVPTSVKWREINRAIRKFDLVISASPQAARMGGSTRTAKRWQS
jgi:hypothetical protein